MELESKLGHKLTFLRKYGFNVNLPLLLPTDIGLLLKTQRCLESKIIYDVHQVHSRPHYIGLSPSNIGISVVTFGQLITSQFTLRDPLGKYYLSQFISTRRTKLIFLGFILKLCLQFVLGKNSGLFVSKSIPS